MRTFKPCARAVGAAALAALVMIGALGGATPAAAQFAVIDAAHIAVNQYWHYLHYLQFALQIYQHYQQIANQVRQINNQLQALRKLSNPNWREVYDLLANLDFIMRQGQALAYSYKDIDGQFQKAFPGWTPVQSWPAQRQLQATRTLDTMRTGLDTVAEQFRHDIADQLFLERMKTQTAGIHGHQEALELEISIELYIAQELGVIKQSLAVSNNMQAVATGQRLNRESQGEATAAAAFGQTIESNGADSPAGFSAIPSWWPFF
jgi:P-type conjugative transfer protein TrbJ